MTRPSGRSKSWPSFRRRTRAAIHRWRAVIDFYAGGDSDPETGAALTELFTDEIRDAFTKLFPCGVVEGYPDVYDQDEKRAKIETPFHA